MPVVFRFHGLVFFFFTSEHLPIHIHLRRGNDFNRIAKFNVDPEIKLFSNSGLKNKDLKTAEKVIKENQDIIIKRWNEVLGS